MSSIIVDTNVLIYGLDQGSAYHQSASQILSNPSNQLYIPSKVISEYFAVCSKLNISFNNTWSFYHQFKKNSTFLYPDVNSLQEFETLLQKYQPKGNRIFDLEIISVTLANQISTIATANIGDFQSISEITILPIVRV